MWGWFGVAIAAISSVFLLVAGPSHNLPVTAQSQPSASILPAAPVALVSTELTADSRGHFLTDAEIDGTTIKVLVDTGASAVALSYEDADNAGLRPHSLDYNVPIGTANGVVAAARVSLRRVEVDGVMVRDVEGLVLPQGVSNITLLGMTFLSRLRSFKVEDGILHLED